MPPTTITADAVNRVNKGMSAVLALQWRLGCVSPPDVIPTGDDDRICVRYWLTMTYSILIKMSWDDAVKEYILSSMATPDLTDVRSLGPRNSGSKLMPTF